MLFDIFALNGRMVHPPHLDRGSALNHLLVGLLRYKPVDRATAAQVLEMPFIKTAPVLVTFTGRAALALNSCAPDTGQMQTKEVCCAWHLTAVHLGMCSMEGEATAASSNAKTLMRGLGRQGK